MEDAEHCNEGGSVCTDVMIEARRFNGYGFAIFDEESPFFLETKVNDESSEGLLSKLDEEWHKVFSNWFRYTRRYSGVKLQNLIERGVPDRMRGELWTKLLQVDILKRSIQFDYEAHMITLRNELVNLGITEFNTARAEETLRRLSISELNVSKAQMDDLENLRQIILDLGRTFPTHIMFLGDSSEAIEGRASLFRILASYAKYNPEVGYCQGMSFIAGMLAIVLPEKEAFWCLVVLLEKSKYLHGYFDAKLEKIKSHALIFDQLLRNREPELWNHLHSHCVHPLMYVTPWFMCLFTSFPCWDTVLAIWDLVLLNGFVVIFETALALMQVMKPHLLLLTDVNTLIPFLQKPSVECLKRSVLLPIIHKVKVQRWEIDGVLAVIVEEKHNVNESTVARNSIASTGLTKKWSRIRERLIGKKPAKKDNILIKAFSKMFVGKQVTPLVEALSLEKISKSNDKENYDSPIKTLRASWSMKADVTRIRRLKALDGKFESTESLFGVVRNLVGSPAQHKWSFQEFTHQLPLRETNLNASCSTCASGPTSSPETELKTVGLNSSLLNVSGISDLDCVSPNSSIVSRQLSQTSLALSQTPEPHSSTPNPMRDSRNAWRIGKLNRDSRLRKKLRLL